MYVSDVMETSRSRMLTTESMKEAAHAAESDQGLVGALDHVATVQSCDHAWYSQHDRMMKQPTAAMTC